MIVAQVIALQPLIVRSGRSVMEVEVGDLGSPGWLPQLPKVVVNGGS